MSIVKVLNTFKLQNNLSLYNNICSETGLEYPVTIDNWNEGLSFRL